jgi:hypothetical protein
MEAKQRGHPSIRTANTKGPSYADIAMELGKAFLGAAGEMYYMPQQVMRGEKQVMGPDGRVTDDAVRWGADMAGTMTLGSGAVPAQANTLRAGATVRNAPPIERVKTMGGKRMAPDPMLIAHHNISPKGLAVADEIGGLPMPSVAVSRVDAPLNKFGDITLVAPKDFAVPSAKNKVFVGDAYTGRQPRGELILKNRDKVAKAMSDSPEFGHIKNASYYLDMHNSIEDADEKIKIIQTAVAKGLVDPKEFSDMHDLQRASQRAIGYDGGHEGYPGLSAFGAQTEKVLPQGYTYSGNRKKPKPYTLDNVMKEMKGAEKGNSEGFNYGPSSFRAAQLDNVRNFDQVKASRGRIMPEAETKAAYEAFTKEYDGLVEKVAGLSGDKDFGAYDRAAEFMSDYASGKAREWRGVAWVDDLPEDVAKEIRDLAKKAKELPANYMEAKPKRAVGIGEFQGAVVPKGAQDAIETLRRNGVVRIFEYASPEERVGLLQKFPELQFLVPISGAVGAGMISNDGMSQGKWEEAYKAGNAT